MENCPIHAYGGQSGKKRISDVLRAVCQWQLAAKGQVLNCIWLILFCFWCNQFYTEDTVTIVDVLGST